MGLRKCCSPLSCFHRIILFKLGKFRVLKFQQLIQEERSLGRAKVFFDQTFLGPLPTCTSTFGTHAQARPVEIGSYHGLFSLPCLQNCKKTNAAEEGPAETCAHLLYPWLFTWKGPLALAKSSGLLVRSVYYWSVLRFTLGSGLVRSINKSECNSFSSRVCYWQEKWCNNS